MNPFLIIDPDPIVRESIRESFERDGLDVLGVSGVKEALAILENQSVPVILCDTKAMSLEGNDFWKFLKNQPSQSAVILSSAAGSVEGAVQAFRLGAFDFICKPYEMNHLKEVVRRALRHCDLLGKTVVKVPLSSGERTMSSKVLVGQSGKMIEVYKKIARAGLSSSHVLIYGESGTGKELVARAIHENSERKMKRFVAINCGALSESLLESELFGYVRGAFTGAVTDRRGLLEEANGGTLFLDEIGDVSPALQVKLLRVIQEGEIKPVGTGTTRKVDVRIVCATHRNLEQLVSSGSFRQDLYYRLNVIGISLPPLRERLEDLGELVNHFLGRFSERMKKRIVGVSDDAMKVLQFYHWPGNIRELENALERAVNMSESPIVYPEDLPEHLLQFQGEADEKVDQKAESAERLRDVEKFHILAILKQVNYNRSRAAEILGIDRATLYRKAERYGISMDSRVEH